MSNISFENIPAKLMQCMMQTEKYVNGSTNLDTSVLELLRYYVSAINGCAYCIDMHFKEAVAAGETEQRLYSVIIWRETDYYTHSEQALLTWTEAITRMNATTHETQLAFNTLNESFTIEEIANLTLVIIQINAWTRLAKSFGFEPGTYIVGTH